MGTLGPGLQTPAVVGTCLAGSYLLFPNVSGEAKFSHCAHYPDALLQTHLFQKHIICLFSQQDIASWGQGSQTQGPGQAAETMITASTCRSKFKQSLSAVGCVGITLPNLEAAVTFSHHGSLVSLPPPGPVLLIQPPTS